MRHPPSPADSLALLALAVFGAVVVWANYSFSQPIAEEEAWSEFSAERAFAHLSVIAQEPRSLHRPHYERSRDHVVTQLAARGVAVELQEATAHGTSATVFFSTVQNVVARIEGRSGSRGAVLLIGHLDSEPFVSPGATDDGAAVAVMLEVARAITSGPRPENPIILLFTGPEESATEGAVAFITEHRWAGDVRVVINLDGLGVGRLALLSLSEENGWLISQLASAGVTMMAQSPITELTPSPATDFGRAFKAAGFAGFDFTTIKASRVHEHTRMDDLGLVRLPDLQDQGQGVLSLVRRLGDADLSDVKGADHIYFTLLNRVVVHYPKAWSPGLGAVLVVLLGMTLWVGAKRRLIGAAGVGVSSAAVLASLVGTLVGAKALWYALSRWHPLYQVLFNETEYNRLPLFMAFTALAALSTVGSLSLLHRAGRVRFEEVMVGVAATMGVAGAAGSLLLPAISYVVLWSAVALCLATLLGFLPGDDMTLATGNMKVALLGLAGVVSIALQLPNVLATYGTPPSDALRPLAGVLLFVPLMPLAYGVVVRRGTIAIALLGVVLLVSLLVATTRGFTEERPRVAFVWLLHDADNNRSFWAAAELYRGGLDQYSAQFVDPSEGQRSVRDFVPEYPIDYRSYFGPAAVVDTEPPAVEVLADVVEGDVRTVSLRVSSPRGAYEVTAYRGSDLELIDYEVSGLRPEPLFGRAPEEVNPAVLFHFRNVPKDGFELTLRVPVGRPVEIKLRDRSFGLPTVAGIRPMPDDMIHWVDRGGGGVNVIKTFRF